MRDVYQCCKCKKDYYGYGTINSLSVNIQPDTIVKVGVSTESVSLEHGCHFFTHLCMKCFIKVLEDTVKIAKKMYKADKERYQQKVNEEDLEW